MFAGSGPRKMVLTASRNGYYFTLDRHTGEHLVTSKFSETVNWASGLNAKGQPIRDPAKDHDIGVGSMGSYISAIDYNTGKTVWRPKFRTAGTPRGAPGLLATAGTLLFGGDISGNFVAFDPMN